MPKVAICNICSEKPIDHTFPNCGHCVCEDCAENIHPPYEDADVTCPFCNEDSIFVQKLYNFSE